MKKFIKVFLIFVLLISTFNKKIIVFYYLNKLKWVERPVEVENVNFKYSGFVEIEKIKIKNLDKLYQSNIFEAEKIILEVDVNTLFSNLIIIKN